MLYLLSIEPLANEVRDNIPNDARSNRYEEQRNHWIHLLSENEKGTNGEIILAERFLRGKRLEKVLGVW